MVEPKKFIYLRTRSAFGLTAGGSVAHTAGVINALRKTANVEVISNDVLPEVLGEYEIIKPIRLSFFPVALNEFLYNIYLLMKLPIPESGTVIYQRLSAYSFIGAFWANNERPFVLEHNGSEAWGLKNWSKQHDTKSIKGWLMNVYKHLFEIPFVKIIEKYNLSKASLIVVVSNELRQQLLAKKIPQKKIVCYPNGVDPGVFTPDIDGLDVRKSFGLTDEIVFGFIGSFGQWHGTDIMARAIVTFYKAHPENKGKVKFLLIGDGLMMKEVKTILSELSNPEDVILPGTIAQNLAPTYLAACDVLVSPHKSNPDGTKFFGSPTKLFEYMAMGKPIIASSLEQIDEILSHKNTAYMVHPDDPSQLAEAFKELSTNLPTYKNMGELARKDVLKKFTWEIHVDEFVKPLTKPSSSE